MTKYELRKAPHEDRMSKGFLAIPPENGDIVKIYTPKKPMYGIVIGEAWNRENFSKRLEQKVVVDLIKEPDFKDIDRFYSPNKVVLWQDIEEFIYNLIIKLCTQ